MAFELQLILRSDHLADPAIFSERLSYLQFPPECVYCCQPSVEMKTVRIRAKDPFQVMKGEENPSGTIDLPYCQEHLAKTKKLWSTELAVIIGVAILIAFYFAFFGLPEQDSSAVASVFAGCCTLVIIGIPAGVLAWFITRLVLIPFSVTAKDTAIFPMGPSSEPLGKGGKSLGFSAKYRKHPPSLILNFHNSEFAKGIVDLFPTRDSQ